MKDSTAGAAIAALLPSAPADARLPRHIQIYRRVREAILNGSLPPGSRLPSARTLAHDLGMSRTTIETAYGQLSAEGLITRTVGSGSFVPAALPSALLRPVQPTRSLPQAAPPPAVSAWGSRLLDAAEEVRDEAPTLRGFAPCVPDYAAFPLAIWNRLAARRARLSGVALLGRLDDPMGWMPLREQIAAYVGTARGVRCDPEQVCILSSAQQALDLCARLLAEPGDDAWIEDPGYRGARAVLSSAGLSLVPIPVDQNGMDVEVGIQQSPRARLAYVTPSHQYPTGETLALPRRLALLAHATQTGMWVIEDDYDSEFRYTGRPLAALQGLDRAGRVLYIGTFNKALFPAIRLAYVIVPPTLIPLFATVSEVSGTAPSIFLQAVLADFLAQGYFAALLRQMRSRYQERRDALRSAMQAEFGERLHLGPTETGLHAIAYLHPGRDDERVSQQAVTRGLTIPPLSRYYLDPSHRRPGLLLGYAAVPASEIRQGIATLAAVLESADKEMA